MNPAPSNIPVKKLKVVIAIIICLVYTAKTVAEPNQPAYLKTIPPEVNKPHKPNEPNYPHHAGVNLSEKAGKLQEPIGYVLSKFRGYDLVMIGERHWTHEEPVFIQNLIKRCCEKKAVSFIFLEFGNFEDQPKIEAFLKEPQYNPKPVIDALRNSYEFGWGYQEYSDIFKLVYNENKNRPEKEKIKIVLVNGPPSSTNIDNLLFQCFDNSSLSETEKWQKVTWLREGIAGRDVFMAEVIAAYLFSDNSKKGIYYAGSSHIRKDVRKKNYGLQLFSTGGILSRKYPARVSCLTFHQQPEYWQNIADFDYLEGIFKNHGKPFAVDTNDPTISLLKLKSDINQQGMALSEAFDGYIMLNQNKNYQPCGFVPSFYDDDFAKVIWDRLRKKGDLERLPPEYSQWKEKTPTGEELMKLIKDGLH